MTDNQQFLLRHLLELANDLDDFTGMHREGFGPIISKKLTDMSKRLRAILESVAQAVREGE